MVISNVQESPAAALCTLKFHIQLQFIKVQGHAQWLRINIPKYTSRLVKDKPARCLNCFVNVFGKESSYMVWLYARCQSNFTKLTNFSWNKDRKIKTKQSIEANTLHEIRALLLHSYCRTIYHLLFRKLLLLFLCHWSFFYFLLLGFRRSMMSVGNELLCNKVYGAQKYLFNLLLKS